MSLAHKKFDKRKKGFTLVEVITATSILALITSSVWVVIDRCTNSIADSKFKMQAFEVARENMETILSKSSVSESIEYGTSDRYPAIEWETVIETFYEPINSQMWLRALCSAMYYDTNGEKQTVGLEHWLTGLSKEQLLQILMNQEEGSEQKDSDLIDNIEDAAAYTGVDANTVEKWINDGMLTTDNGSFIKNNLDIFKASDGKPSDETKKNNQVSSEQDIKRLKAKQNQKNMENDIDPTTGLTYGQIQQMDIQEIWDIMKQKRESGVK
jgi:prepilin-type N-terminal cleavage/methylation domain-containing protein